MNLLWFQMYSLKSECFWASYMRTWSPVVKIHRDLYLWQWDYSFKLLRMVKIKKTENSQGWRGCGASKTYILLHIKIFLTYQIVKWYTNFVELLSSFLINICILYSNPSNLSQTKEKEGTKFSVEEYSEHLDL